MTMERSQVEQLAQLYGLETEFFDTWGNKRVSSTESLVDTCRLLGAEIAGPEDVAGAIQRRQFEIHGRILEPVNVVREEEPAVIRLKVTAADRHAAYELHLELEDETGVNASGNFGDLQVSREMSIEGESYVELQFALPRTLPRGYHRLTLRVNEAALTSLIISAPHQAFSFPADSRRNQWGAFLPLYSLHREHSPQTGNLSDLGELMQWIADCGGSFVATLPLLGTVWELGEDPSPYQPTTRLLWNEFYIDLTRIPEYADLPEELKSSIEQGDKTELVHYAEEMSRKRQALELMSDAFFANTSERVEQLLQDSENDPELDMYARFRAVGERQGKSWPEWPERLQKGEITPDDYDERIYHLHLFTQWQMRHQLADIKQQADARGLLWYLDYPVGVHGNGYDVWRNQDIFVRQADGGAPPDTFFTKGQNWGFPPVHPEKLRQQEYGYFIQAIRSHLEKARILRLDHVMGLYRFYWIPRGHGADDGVYVRYPLEEMMAILAVESHRYGARIIGENLGTVPDQVDEALDRYDIDGMYVLQFETRLGDSPEVFSPVPTRVAASINTHDTPPFAAYWDGTDIDDRLGQNLMSEEDASWEHGERAEVRRRVIEYLRNEQLLEGDSPSGHDVLSAAMAWLARSDAEFVLVNLEDLWGEVLPQNRPGTSSEQPNWRRRARYSFEQFRDRPEVREVLARMAGVRAEK
ncbi:MAG: 4-alpha-glucanotransferase [Planctomyces sp.]|nr:4-alpha-glucanotransferase [Planctomyces sp.]